MKLHSPVLSVSIAIILAFNVSFSCPVYAQNTTNNIVSNYTKVVSLTEFNKVLETASSHLQTSLILNAPNANLTTYSSQLDHLTGINSYHITLTRTANMKTLKIQLSYKQAFKLAQYQKNPALYSLLTANDLKLYAKAKSIVSTIIAPGMSDYDKELAIHNYIVNQTNYDYENLQKNTLPNSAFTAYGVLFNKKAVCEGYSEATKLLLNLAGIECEIVTGTTSTSTAHAWNIVKLDNEWYMLDTTYDDPISFQNGKRVETLVYDYFNVTSKFLSNDHTWDTSKFPVASGTKYNYYVASNKLVNSYDEFKSYVVSQLKAGQKDIICYVNNYTVSQYDLNFIFDYYKGKISYSAPTSSSGSFRILLT